MQIIFHLIWRHCLHYKTNRLFRCYCNGLRGFVWGYLYDFVNELFFFILHLCFAKWKYSSNDLGQILNFFFLEIAESFKIRHSCRRSFVIIPQLASMSFHHSFTDGKILQLVAVDSIQVISLLKPNWFLERGLGKKYRQWLRPWKSSKQCQDFQPNDSVSNSLKFDQMRL